MTVSLTNPPPSHKSTVTSLDAFANINVTSEHAMTDSLRSFLEMNLHVVFSKKKDEEEEEGSILPFSLGIIDSRLSDHPTTSILFDYLNITDVCFES